MRELFPIRRDDGPVDRCGAFLKKYCHPVQIGTGLIFSTIGIGLTAAGFMYADGISFAVHSISDIPQYLAHGADFGGSIDYVRESYRESMSQAVEAGWKQLPLSYCVGHYVGGKLKEIASAPFRRR